KRISVLFFGVTLGLCLLLSSPVNANTYNKIVFLNASNGFRIAKLAGAEETNVSWYKNITVKVWPSKITDKMRLEAIDAASQDACQFDKVTGQMNTNASGRQYYTFRFQPKESAQSCSLRVIGWRNPWNWLGRKDFKLNFSSEEKPKTTTGSTTTTTTTTSPTNTSSSNDQKNYVITVGTNSKSEMSVGSITNRGGHGIRIYCPVSHFSYDDPIIFPNQPGKSHLHMFIGNTSSDAFSKPEELLTSGSSSCEGGVNLRSSYWTPAVFNNKDELVLPEQEFVYYKTFISGDSNYDKLQIIPNGLSMLADRSTLNATESKITSKYTTKDGKNALLLGIYFPSCVATKNGQWNGKPILSYKDMPGDKSKVINSHVAYPGGPNKNLVGCPASHPYRTPTMSLKVYYDRANLNNGWYLSSDIDKNQPGGTLHADYIAAWDNETMKRVTKCNIESRSCGFDGGRGQLPERFKSPVGKIVYRNSISLQSDIDRTPYGNLLKPMLN
ncbi:MAG: DUF1996 domain-containing protein, partial [Cyanobacteria bacterium P01_G01_bin.67]